MVSFSIRTHGRVEMIDMTSRIRAALREIGARDGVCHVFIPHTTAAVTINENADPDVPRDILAALERLVPPDGPYRHREGNAPAHVKAALCGSTATFFVRDGEPLLGQWQTVFFCEFDGPRTRQVWVQASSAAG